MHGHMQPQQHPGMHPAHQPPPHLTHLTSLQPHNMQRDHPANRTDISVPFVGGAQHVAPVRCRRRSRKGPKRVTMLPDGRHYRKSVASAAIVPYQRYHPHHRLPLDSIRSLQRLIHHYRRFSRGTATKELVLPAAFFTTTNAHFSHCFYPFPYRLNQAPRHHHPRGGGGVGGGGVVDHSQPAPHLSMQVPPPPPPTHQAQNARKGYYGLPHPGAGMPKALPMTSPHLHPPPPPHQQQQQQQQQQPPPPQQQQQQQQPHLNPMSVVGGKCPPPLPYGAANGGPPGMGQHHQPAPVTGTHHPVTMQAPPPIPVVSAATPAGTKTRHIPSNTDHKIHHHGHSVLQTNGTGGPGPKGIVNHHQTNHAVLGMDKTKVSGGNGPSVGNRHHHNHHHIQHQQHQQQHIVPKPNDAPLPKESPAVIPVTVVSTAPSVAPTLPSHQQQHELPPAPSTGTITTAANGGASSAASTSETVRDAAAPAAAASSGDEALEALANIKEKTTMCLVNELARYNKIQHQYRLTGEAGPAHKKHFTVTLKLGDEEYTAEGASIKKAQHKAAGDAIAATKYKHPPARTNRRTKTGTKGNVSSFTPTVELNALAMKRGEPTFYQVKAVPVPVSKYGGGGGGGGGVASAPPGGRRSVEDKSGVPPPGVGHHPQQQPPPPGYWCRANGPHGGGIAAGVGGRGGMGGFHPGHQQQQHQQQHHHHGHHVRDEHANRHHGAQHNYHHHDGGGRGGGAGGGYHHGDPALQPLVAVHEFYKAVLRVGERTFLGEGHTPQAARHDAAARALEVLKPLTADAADGGKAKHGDGLANGDASSTGDGSAPSDDPNAELKSPISLVHEIAVQRSLSVVFEVISEKGPPHMTVFVTQCKVGTIVTEGEGTGKKLSKKRAAERMLEELRKLQKAEQAAYAASNGGSSPSASVSSSAWPDGGTPSATPSAAEKRKSNPKTASPGAVGVDGVATAKKKARNLIKERSAADVPEKENPISRLMQIQQARKEKQPVYTLVENDRPSVGRRRQFTMEVAASGCQATGVGMTKKAAKWNAAEALLIELGYATPEPKGSPAAAAAAAAATTENKENQSGAANDSSPSGGKRPRKVRFQGESAQAAAPNALTNGVNQGKGETSNDSMNDSIGSNDSAGTNSSGVSSASSAAPKADIGAKKEQLMYLAQLLKFEVQFSDFPKGNHGEYLTLVILSTEPPQLCHGNGASLQESHDEAARGALEMLSKIGLDNVKPKAAASSTNNAAPPDDAIQSPAPAVSVTNAVAPNGK
uniref:DRBM domain-containing protein n=1 Tax=Anopheles farauti TaxID=69004 RepID=A0A182QGI1_9DIPT